MDILPNTDIKSTIDRLLPWLQNTPSGETELNILEHETKLGYKIPDTLRILYLLAGKDQVLMSSYNRFIPLDKLKIEDEKMIFLEENQGASIWAIDLNTENSLVYVQSIESVEWLVEDINLGEFLAMIIHMQCFQMGYKHCGIIGLSGDSLYDVLHTEWEKVIDYNGMHVYWQEGALIWSIEFSEEEDIENDIFFSTPFEEVYYLNEVRYELAEI